VSNEHPYTSQPVAAGPAKVGANSPRLDDVTTGFAFVEAAAVLVDARKKALTSITDKVAIEDELNLHVPFLVKSMGFS
jgi:hypothetical protein